jgi:protein SCO1/2
MIFVSMSATLFGLEKARSHARSTMAAAIGFLVCILLFVSGCGKQSKQPLRFQVRGVVQGLPPDHQTIAVEHEDIPGFMPSMTMPFTARDRNDISGLKPGDAISFRLNVTEHDSWIDEVRKIDRAAVHLPATTPRESVAGITTPRFREGDRMPEFELTNQDGKTVTREAYEGHPFLITFIFTRCPIPNFCPLMSRHFAALEQEIKNSSGRLGQTRLLSISFDPEFDTPKVLKDYSQAEQADPAIWTFATGRPVEIQKLTKGFSVLVQPEKGTISHSLATALVDEEGKIVRIWRGNGWTPAEVVAELSSSKPTF